MRVLVTLGVLFRVLVHGQTGVPLNVTQVAATTSPPNIITTFAGTTFAFPVTPIAARDTPLADLRGMAVDGQGNLYLADALNHNVTKVEPDGTLTVIAGNGIEAVTGDGGPATSAAVGLPNGIAADSAGNLYLTDFLNCRVRKVSNTGIITTIAGTGTCSDSGDGGPAAVATVESPQAIVVDHKGNLFLATPGEIRKITPAGVISKAADNRYNGAFVPVTALALDNADNLYIAGGSTGGIRKLTSGGVLTMVTTEQPLSPIGIAADGAGNLYVSVSGQNSVYQISPAGAVSTFAGFGLPGYLGDGGPAASASLSSPRALTADAAGNVYIADGPRVRVVNAAGTISTVAGNGLYDFTGDYGPAQSATFNSPRSIIRDGAGNLYVLDGGYIREITPDGTIQTVANGPDAAILGDGAPALFTMLSPSAIAADGQGNLYVSDGFLHKIRKITPDNLVHTVAGNGSNVYSGDGGPALQAGIPAPGALAVDTRGNIYVADGSNRIRKIDTNGIISTYAGNGVQLLTGPNKQGNYGEGGQATSASLGGVSSLASDGVGNLYICDGFSSVVRRVNPGGIVTTVAGDLSVPGFSGYSGDGGPATAAKLNLPGAIALDQAGNLFIADTANNVVRKVDTSGVISTVAGNAHVGYSGDGGPATSATLDAPEGVAVDAAGDVFIADTFNSRIREVLSSSPAILISPCQLQFTASSGGAIPPVQTITATGSIPLVTFSTTQASTGWLQVSPQTGALPRVIEVTADPTNLKPGTYSGTIVINAANATPSNTNVQVTFTVGPGQPPQLAIDKPTLSFPFPVSGSPRGQTVTVSNAGGGVLQYSAATQTITGGNWLSVSPSSGQVTPASLAALIVTANPSSLPPGTYSGTLTISAGASTKTVSVTMTISQLSQAILLSQTGLSFLGEVDGGVILPQTFGVINIGSGVVNWTVSTSTLSGGNWLQVDTASGSTDAAAVTVPTVGVSVNPDGLAAGKYYGLVSVAAPGAANTPQVLTVFLQVLPAGTPTDVAAQPGELLFTASAGGESPGSQVILLSNISGLPTSFRASGIFSRVLPADGTLDLRNPTHVVVQPFTGPLPSGVYRDPITFQFSDGRVAVVNAKIVVSSGVKSGSSSGGAARALAVDTASCQPTQLLTALTTLGQSFAASAGWPVALGVDVKDDCGNPLDTPGTVLVNFSNGDPPLALRSVKGGHWEGTWTTSSSSANVNLTVQATDASRQLRGTSQISGALQSPTDPPVFTLQGIVSAAAPLSFEPTAPGSIISIYGNLLAQNNMPATAIPLPFTIANTQVFMAGESLPLYYVSQTQLNVLVPYDINPNAPQQILVQRGLTYSQPVSVNVAPAQPAIFTDASVSPTQGIIIAVRNQGSSQIQFEAKPGSPATAGDVIVISTVGLGAVTPSVSTGSAPGPVPSNTTNTVQVNIGGQSTSALFAGLVPGFVGLYQVNAVVPNGVAVGDAVPVTLTVAGQTSPQVTMAIQ